MFLIYIIGGIIPFVIATFYISQQSRNLILEQNKKAQQEEARNPAPTGLATGNSAMKADMNVNRNPSFNILRLGTLYCGGNQQELFQTFSVCGRSHIARRRKPFGSRTTRNPGLQRRQQLQTGKVKPCKSLILQGFLFYSRFACRLWRRGRDSNSWYRLPRTSV